MKEQRFIRGELRGQLIHAPLSVANPASILAMRALNSVSISSTCCGVAHPGGVSARTIHSTH